MMDTNTSNWPQCSICDYSHPPGPHANGPELNSYNEILADHDAAMARAEKAEAKNTEEYGWNVASAKARLDAALARVRELEATLGFREAKAHYYQPEVVKLRARIAGLEGALQPYLGSTNPCVTYEQMQHARAVLEKK